MRAPKQTLAELDAIAARAEAWPQMRFVESFVQTGGDDLRDLVALARTLQARLDEARRERDAYKRAKAENDERFLSERDVARAKYADALKVLEAMRISVGGGIAPEDDPEGIGFGPALTSRNEMAGEDNGEGISEDEMSAAVAALARIRSDLATVRGHS